MPAMADAADVVTGASGHLGNVLVRSIASQGRPVKGLYRSVPDVPLPQDVEVAYGDVCDVSSLIDAFHGARRVFHCAGLVAIGLGARKQLHRVNVNGTKNVITACEACDIERLIYISSIEAFELESGIKPIREDSGIIPNNTALSYGKSKALATTDVLSATYDGRINGITLFPTGFIGPHDYKLSPMTSLIADFSLGKVPAKTPGGFDFVDVRDVALGAISAAEIGSIGDRYILPGNHITVDGLFSILEELTDMPAPRFQIPGFFRQTAGFLSELYCAARQTQPRYSRKSLKLLSIGVSVDGSKAVKELGYHARPTRESIRDTLVWLQSQGIIGGGFPLGRA